MHNNVTETSTKTIWAYWSRKVLNYHWVGSCTLSHTGCNRTTEFCNFPSFSITDSGPIETIIDTIWGLRHFLIYSEFFPYSPLDLHINTKMFQWVTWLPKVCIDQLPEDNNWFFKGYPTALYLYLGLTVFFGSPKNLIIFYILFYFCFCLRIDTS